MGRAEDIFARLEVHGEKYVDELIASRAAEELFLDFKRSSNNGGTPRLDDHDRKHFAKALSGFANSEGGVIVWGVDCRPGSSGADVAGTKHPLQDAARFTSQLDAVVSGLTVPAVPGVRSIPLRSMTGPHLAATLIPSSSQAPHERIDENRYYIRSGSSFVPMPRNMLAGLFGRRPHPDVFPNIVAHPAKGKGNVVQTSCDIVLVNNGMTVGTDLFVSARFAASGGENFEVATELLSSEFHLTQGLAIDFSAMGSKNFRLAPQGMVKVLSVKFTMDGKPTAGLEWTVTAGSGAGIPYSATYAADREALASHYQYCIDRWSDMGARSVVASSNVAQKIMGLTRHIPGEPYLSMK